MSEGKESWSDYIARRMGICFVRQKAASASEEEPVDPHFKAGCFACDQLWFGPNAQADAYLHQDNANHEIWVINTVPPAAGE
jgi:hypothetical protein